MKLTALVLSCLLLLSPSARADNAATFNAMLALATKGDAEAQYHVGMMYNNGIGRKQDPEQAFKWFQKSAVANDPLGAYKLGCYYAGQFPGVVKTSPEEALKYKLIAAWAGYSLAQHDVAVHYAEAGNFEEAVKWLTFAAAQGFDQSLFGLSRLYYTGAGTPRDDAVAYAYLKLALEVSGAETSSRMQAALDDMIANMDSAERAKSERMVSEWKPQPTALTIEAGRGLEAAEEHVLDALD